MKTLWKTILALTLVLFLMSTVLSAGQKMAVIIKVKGDVKYKNKSEKKFTKAAKTGIILEDGDNIKTGSDGYMVLVFLDDKSQVKLFENCNLEVTGEKLNGALSKNMTMGFGKIRAEVARQRKGEFKIATPTSVASVKGTDFWMISDEVTGDQIIGLSGLVELLSQISGTVVMVGADQTGYSNTDGSVSVAQTNPEDVPEESESGETELEPSQLKIDYQNSNGEIKQIIIDYR